MYETRVFRFVTVKIRFAWSDCGSCNFGIWQGLSPDENSTELQKQKKENAELQDGLKETEAELATWSGSRKVFDLDSSKFLLSSPLYC